jgi:hypothetical protein
LAASNVTVDPEMAAIVSPGGIFRSRRRLEMASATRLGS